MHHQVINDVISNGTDVTVAVNAATERAVDNGSIVLQACRAVDTARSARSSAANRFSDEKAPSAVDTIMTTLALGGILMLAWMGAGRPLGHELPSSFQSLLGVQPEQFYPSQNLSTPLAINSSADQQDGNAGFWQSEGNAADQQKIGEAIMNNTPFYDATIPTTSCTTIATAAHSIEVTIPQSGTTEISKSAQNQPFPQKGPDIYQPNAFDPIGQTCIA